MNSLTGKGDLVGCDIPVQMMHGHPNGMPSSGTSTSQDVIVKSSSDVKALTYCDLKSIHISGLVDVLRLYPEYQQEFANDIQHDLTYNLREGYEAEEETENMVTPCLALPAIIEADENLAESETIINIPPVTKVPPKYKHL